MEIKVNTSSYNERRYGKPWIARVDFSTNRQGDFIWGEWVGDHRNGSEGTLFVTADEGDIVARGQKDFRNPRNSAPDFYQVRNGSLEYLDGGKSEALRVARGG